MKSYMYVPWGFGFKGLDERIFKFFLGNFIKCKFRWMLFSENIFHPTTRKDLKIFIQQNSNPVSDFAILSLDDAYHF